MITTSSPWFSLYGHIPIRSVVFNTDRAIGDWADMLHSEYDTQSGPVPDSHTESSGSRRKGLSQLTSRPSTSQLTRPYAVRPSFSPRLQTISGALQLNQYRFASLQALRPSSSVYNLRHASTNYQSTLASTSLQTQTTRRSRTHWSGLTRKARSRNGTRKCTSSTWI